MPDRNTQGVFRDHWRTATGAGSCTIWSIYTKDHTEEVAVLRHLGQVRGREAVRAGSELLMQTIYYRQTIKPGANDMLDGA